MCIRDRSERGHVLTDECQECVLIGVDVLDKTIQQLLSGDISVAKLKLLAGGMDKFLEVFRVVEENAQNDVFKVPESGVKGMNRAAVLQKVIIWRKKEQHNLESMCRLISYFVSICGDIHSGWLLIKLFV